MTDNTHDFLTHLWRGGEWAYFWTPDGKPYTDKQTGEIKQGKLSHWFPAGTVAALPKAWATKNVYFGVHPAHTQRQQWERARLVDVAAINCLFAEFDGKDQVTPGEYSPHLPPDFDKLPAVAQRAAIVDAQQAIFLADRETHKARIMAQLDALWNGGDDLPYPSVVIDSQGGYHCYWLLEQTVTIDDGNREHIKALQAAWVDLVGADPASKDLARVLRLPGTQNRKTHYAPDFPTVTFVECNLSRLYALDIFEQFANVDAAGHAAHQAMAATAGKQTDDVIASFNQSHSLVDLLTDAGYTLGWQRGNVARLSRPGKPKNETSVIVFTDINRSYHHSGNDPLHTTGHTRDAFDVWTHITHNGDTKAAWAAAKQEQGKWEAAPVLVFDHEASDSRNDDGAPEDEDDAIETHPLNVQPVMGMKLGWIDDYASLVTEMTNSPREFNQLAALVTVAAALQRKARVRMRFADIYPNIYGCIIAPSSAFNKTVSIQKPRMVLQRAQLEKLVLSELATSEGLLKELQGQSSGVILRDEIGTLFDSHNVKYLRNLKPDLTAIFDCFPYSRRLSNEEIKVEKPYLSILGATTPTRFFEGVTQTDWQDGFLARWLFVTPTGEPDFDAEAGLFDNYYESSLQKLAGNLYRFNQYELTDFVFEGDALQMWWAWLKTALRDSYYFKDEVVSAIVKRYGTYALKFGIILSAINGSWGRITPETMETALHLADNYKNSAYRLMSEKDDHRISGASLQKVFRAIHTHAGNADAKRILQTTGLKKVIVKPCLDKLCSEGAIVPMEVKRTNKAGKSYTVTVYVAMTKELPIKAWR